MKIALIGYGKIGREVEKTALERGHQIVAIIDKDNQEDLAARKLSDADVAIEFTTPETAALNIRKCLEMKLPVVSGTTGWLNEIDTVRQFCEEMGGTFFYASNFSPGVNILLKVNTHLASIMKGFDNYSACISETHHKHKKDSPSGTAISLARGIISEIPSVRGWVNQKSEEKGILPILSYREGEVFGDHIVSYESDADLISIRHTAKSRRGFAMGAVLAAEFILEKKGVFSMDDLLNIHSIR